jgi:hypothetical protein
MTKSKLITGLEELYTSFIGENNNWVKENSLLLNYARHSQLVLGGSIAMSITNKKAHKHPGDIDLFTNNNEAAWDFITKVQKYLHNKKGSHYRIFVNNETKFTLEGVKSHYRIVGPPYWLPVCVMVLKNPIRKFYWNNAPVQYFDDVIAAAKKVTERDEKPRVPEFMINHDEFVELDGEHSFEDCIDWQIKKQPIS